MTTTTNTIRYNWFDSKLNPNSSAHWSKKMKLKANQRALGFLLTRGSPPPISRTLTIVFCPPNKRRRDIDNCLASIKSLIDGMADAWKLDDSVFDYVLRRGEKVDNGAIDITYNI